MAGWHFLVNNSPEHRKKRSAFTSSTCATDWTEAAGWLLSGSILFRQEAEPQQNSSALSVGSKSDRL